MMLQQLTLVNTVFVAKTPQHLYSEICIGSEIDPGREKHYRDIKNLVHLIDQDNRRGHRHKQSPANKKKKEISNLCLYFDTNSTLQVLRGFEKPDSPASTIAMQPINQHDGKLNTD